METVSGIPGIFLFRSNVVLCDGFTVAIRKIKEGLIMTPEIMRIVICGLLVAILFLLVFIEYLYSRIRTLTAQRNELGAIGKDLARINEETFQILKRSERQTDQVIEIANDAIHEAKRRDALLH